MQPEIKTFDVAGLGFPCRLGAAVFTPQSSVRGTVLAVHGLSRQKRDFDDIAGFLCAQGYRVLALDAPGRGGSSWLAQSDDYNLQNYARIFDAFMEQQGLDAVHWIGTSMGGLLALVMAEMGMAARFKSVTFVDITHRPNLAACQRIAGYMTSELPVFESAAQYLPILRQNLPLGDAPDNVWQRFADEQLVKVPAGYAFHFDPNIVPLAKVQLSQPIDLSAGLAAMQCPVALVAGAISDLCTSQEIADFCAAKPQASVHVVPKAGHIPALHDTDSQQFIYGFINSCS